MSAKTTTSPRRHAINAVCGILLATVTLYFILRLPEIVAGSHYWDFDLLRFLATVGLITLAVSFFEGR